MLILPRRRVQTKLTKHNTVLQQLYIYETYLQLRGFALSDVRVFCNSPESRRQSVKITKFLFSFKFHDVETVAAHCGQYKTKQEQLNFRSVNVQLCCHMLGHCV
jgi:hypothetical protein